MTDTNFERSPLKEQNSVLKNLTYLIDLALYITVMFLIREIYFSNFNFITNGLFWSLSTLITATIILKFRKTRWRDIGLSLPTSYRQAAIATVFIIGFSIASIIVFEIAKDNMALGLSADQSNANASAKFGELNNNWLLFFSIIPFIWLQSALEEILDRGFLINWIERALSCTWFATVSAVLIQAMLFGFRHSYDISERSISVALIGLAMGIGYVAFGRNLWPLIIAHCVMNTLSMLERV
ncbi:MAG: CPBP family intramembrane metalloprotease [Gammaproteobacteria bacterium]|nr:CPBP family intramembrane metalloprotease [Gammaproteobacteria bacterium]